MIQFSGFQDNWAPEPKHSSLGMSPLSSLESKWSNPTMLPFLCYYYSVRNVSVNKKLPIPKNKVPKRYLPWKKKFINIHILQSNQDVDVNIKAVSLIVFRQTDANQETNYLTEACLAHSFALKVSRGPCQLPEF